MKQYKISCIYTITNFLDGKIYVGYTNNFYKRKRKHFNQLLTNTHSNKHLQNAYNRDGVSNFLMEILEEWDIEFLKSMEHYWCNLLNTHDRDFGYNIEPTSPFGNITSSKETKEKQSKIAKSLGTAKGKKFALGHKHTEEFKQYMSKVNSKPKSEEMKKKVGDWHRGKIVSLETRQKLSLAKKGIKSKHPLKINQYDLKGNLVKTWESSEEIAKAFNVTKTIPRSGLSKGNKIWKGFKWQYAETYKNRK